jgi:hypothetical protein
MPVPAVPTATPATASSPQLGAPALAHDAQYFAETGFRVDDRFVTLFQERGGLDAFGYPASRAFTFLGCPVQIFQRLIAQECPGGGPGLLNLLDPEIFPYTRVNGTVFPGPDDALKALTPAVGTPEYGAILDFIRANTPDTFEGEPVNFQHTFFSRGGLDTWGTVISQPQRDPSNADFVYQRLQRGIMHYRKGVGTESILLADYLKAILRNSPDVPADLRDQARSSRFFAQYQPGQPGWLARPGELEATDLSFAFEPG